MSENTYNHLFATLTQKYRHHPVTPAEIRAELDGSLQGVYGILQQLDELAKDQLAEQIHTVIQSQKQSGGPVHTKTPPQRTNAQRTNAQRTNGPNRQPRVQPKTVQPKTVQPKSILQPQPSNGLKHRPISQPKIQPKTQARVQPKTQAKSQTKTQSETQTKSQTKTQSETQAKSQTKSEITPGQATSVPIIDRSIDRLIDPFSHTKKPTEFVILGTSPALISTLYLCGKFLEVPIGKYSQVWPLFVGVPVKSLILLFTSITLTLATPLVFFRARFNSIPTNLEARHQPKPNLPQTFQRLRDVCRCGWLDSKLHGLDRELDAKRNHLYATQDVKGVSKKKVKGLEAAFHELRDQRDQLRTQAGQLKEKF